MFAGAISFPFFEDDYFLEQNRRRRILGTTKKAGQDHFQVPLKKLLKYNKKKPWSSKFFSPLYRDCLAKSPLAPFRSWFDTSPRTENQTFMLLMIRSP